MTKRTIEIDLSGSSVDRDLAGILKGFLARTGATAKARAQQIIGEEVKDRSGNLKSHTNFDIIVKGDKVYMEFYNDAGEYALFQHEGTGIYGPRKRPIRPVRAKMLTWIDPDTGQRIWAKEVRGTPAKKFLTRAIEFALDQEIKRMNP